MLAQKPQRPDDDEPVEDPQNQPRPRAARKRPSTEAEREKRTRARQDHPEEYDVPIQETYPVSRDDLHGSVIKKSCSTS